MILLKIGSRGPQVELLQSILNRLGYNSGAVDGIFGIRTQNAVRRFQNAVGLSVDGIVGDDTWAALLPYIDGYVSHTVVSGDTFWLLSKKYGTTVAAISAANPTVDPQNLIVGSKITVPLNINVVPTDVSYGYELLIRNIDALKKRYPFISSETAGKSVMGKDIPYICLGGGKNEVFFNASHHANEWITSVLIMRFIENLCKSYVERSNVSDIPAAEIFAKSTIYIIPMVNPDGVDLVTGWLPCESSEYRSAKTIAEKYPDIPFPSGWKANIRGVDLNLNYPAEWDQAKQIKYDLGFTSPAPRDFVGERPFSEPETQMTGRFTKEHDFSLTLSYHTQGELIFWKFLNYFVPDSFEIAQKFADVSGYTLSLTPYESGYAGYKDWFIQEYRRPGYTIEAGKGVNPLPISQFAEIYRDNIGLLSLAAVATT